MHKSLCICALIPTIPTRTRLVLVMHQLETRKTTNTGQLALRCLPNSQTVFRGAGGSDDPPPWVGAANPVLLYPAPDARPIEDWRRSTEPVTLVVPDGTWRQAVKARKRLPGLDAVPTAAIDAAPSGYRLRNAPREGRLSTMEAIARALGVLEGPDVQERLLHIFRVMVDRTLWSNGRIASEAVTGGVPPGVVSHDPLSGGDRSND
jgi:DTW domain-containing protein